MKLVIFYSWQVRTDDKYNKNFIRKCIEKAVKKIERANYPELQNVQMEVQDSARGIPGSPPIADEIFKRISQCDIFISDLSITDAKSWLERWGIKLSGKKIQLHQSLNVVNEHGAAREALGLNQMIGVLNKTYGSPNDNDPETIFFDARHLRFPIEYEYNKKKEREKDKIQDALTADLQTAIKLCAISAIENAKKRHYPFLTWLQCQEFRSNKENFIENETIQQIKQQIKNNSGNLRILGLSGLGKTRIVFESFREQDRVPTEYLYCNCQDSDNTSILGAIQKIFDTKEQYVLVLDNCSLDLCRKILFKKEEQRSTCPIITISNNPEERSKDEEKHSEYIILSKNDLKPIVEKILESKFPDLSKDDLEIIKDFSSGIPLMAVLLANSINEGEKHIGRLADKYLLSRLLSADENSDERKVLQSLSLFNYVGYERESRVQLEFIAKNKNITPIRGEDSVVLNIFDTAISKYLSREIFEKNGRLIGLRPTPLALSLAIEWLDSCPPDRFRKVFDEINALPQPHNTLLNDALSKQMRFLGYNDKAVEIVEKLIDVKTPFDDAKVLNTDLGSRLFRSFVEVNPVAVANNLMRNFGSMPIEELRQINKGRRNLVWVLEKLCFDKRTFEQGAKLLMRFSIAENETYGNNSTTELLHLFKILLPGTEASLAERLSLIRWAYNSKEEQYKGLSIKAMGSALASGHFYRTMGAEIQGTKKLEDYTPSQRDVYDYWSGILDIVSSGILNDSTYSEECSKIITDHARGLCRSGMSKYLLPIIEQLAAKKNFDWDMLLESLHSIRKYEKALLSDDLLAKLNTLIDKLTKTDFLSKYLRVNKKAWRNDLNLGFEELFENQKREYRELAKEFIGEELYNNENILKALYTTNNSIPTVFGVAVADLLENDILKAKTYIEQTLVSLNSIEVKEMDARMFLSFAQTIKHSDIRAYLTERLKESSLAHLLFSIIGALKISEQNLEILFNLINTNKASVENFWNYFNNLDREYFEERVILLNERIFSYGLNGAKTIIHILGDFLPLNEIKFAKLFNILEAALKKVQSSDIINIGIYQYFQALELALKQENKGEFAKYVNAVLLELINTPSYGNCEQGIRDIYEILVNNYFIDTWPQLAEVLMNEDDNRVQFYNLKLLLEPSFQEGNHTTFSKNIETVFEWCKENPKKAPEIFAHMIPFFHGGEIHPLALRLLNEYGDQQLVLSAFDSSIHSYSWTGSVIPLLESRRNILQSIINHPIQEVANWAKRNVIYFEREIADERQKEAEEKFLYS